MNSMSPALSPRNKDSRVFSTDRSEIEAKVIAANVDFYRCVAGKYDSYEAYLVDPDLQGSLEDDLDKIGAHWMSLGRKPSCLECGGGTGNLTLKMCARGWTVTVVDVSGDMLALLKEKAHARGYAPTLIRSSIEEFLKAGTEKFDLVAFSSVLHHLHSYKSVVHDITSRIRPGGLLYSTNDPVIPKRPAWTWAFDSLDITVAKIMLDPADVLPGIWRRLRKMFSHRDPSLGRRVVSPGDIAEFHVRSGVDDANVVRLLKERGFAILEHLRYATGRTSAIRFLNERLRLLESFKIIAQRISEAGVTCARP